MTRDKLPECGPYEDLDELEAEAAEIAFFNDFDDDFDEDFDYPPDNYEEGHCNTDKEIKAWLEENKSRPKKERSASIPDVP